MNNSATKKRIKMDSSAAATPELFNKKVEENQAKVREEEEEQKHQQELQVL
jgi:hypothetical protein